MTGYLTTHVLDTAQGAPAKNMKIELFRLSGERRTKIKTVTTNDDGRTAQHVLSESEFETGEYELVFYAAEYLNQISSEMEKAFLTVIPIRFVMSEHAHYHVPLLLSPYSFSTYRGS